MPAPKTTNKGGVMRVVGVDPSKKWLLCYLKTSKKEKILKIPNEKKGWDKLLKMSPGVVFIEGASNSYVKPFVSYLLKNNIKVKNIAPFHNARIREVISESKDDVKDARACAFIGKYLPEKTGEIKGDELLLQYVSFRKYLIERKVAAVERLQGLLDMLWVDYKKYFPQIESSWCLNFLKNYPSPECIGNIDWSVVFPPKLSVKIKNNIKDRFREVPEVYISRELAGYLKEEIKFLVEDILRLIQQIKDIDSRIKDHINNSEDYRKLLTFPGIKETSAAVILAYVNSRNFRGVNHFLAYSGLVPLRIQTGSQPVYTRKRKRYNRELQNIFVMLAFRLSQSHPISKKYYERKLNEKKRKMTAIWSLARQLAKIIYIMAIKKERYRHQKSTFRTN